MAKKRFTVTISPGDYEELRRWAEAKGDEAASVASYLVQRGIESAKERGEIPTQGDATEERDLLIGFLNCLLDTYDHDGYSLAEIGAILGRKTGDKDLIALIAKLQNGNAKTGARQK